MRCRASSTSSSRMPAPSCASAAAVSRAVRARRASPSVAPTMRSSTPSSTLQRPASPSGAARPRCRSRTTSSACSGSSSRARQRESRAPLTSKDGFSVVAPTRTMSPRSTCGRKASCWALLKRWISSTKTRVRRPVRWRSAAARAISSRISLMPESTAEYGTKASPEACASRRARVVFPTPGGPQRMSDWVSSPARARLRMRPSPTRCVCPQ